jgi:hypothetical protein
VLHRCTCMAGMQIGSQASLTTQQLAPLGKVQILGCQAATEGPPINCDRSIICRTKSPNYVLHAQCHGQSRDC